jgi:hypothetical protein
MRLYPMAFVAERWLTETIACVPFTRSQERGSAETPAMRLYPMGLPFLSIPRWSVGTMIIK